MYQYTFPQLMRVPTIDYWGWKVDSEHSTSFISTIRRYAKKHDDRVRVEGRTLNFYTSDIARMQKIVEYVVRLQNKADETLDEMLDLTGIRYFPGTITERNIHYRKKRLPYGKFKFQILGERMDWQTFSDWSVWAQQYPDDIRVTNAHTIRRWGTWCGESLGYVTNDKLLQLAQFKLGSNINKIIEYQLRETE